MTRKLVISILFLPLILALLCGCEGAGEGKAEENAGNASIYGGIYEISEFLDERQYNEYRNDAGSLFNKLLVFRQKLENSSEFEFYPFANNFLEIINRKIPESCIVNHGSEFEAESEYEIDGERITAAEAIQVSENFFALFPLKISEGRGFEASDFNFRSTESIPVILGNAYRQAFHLGDVFEGYYICERRSFTVIGFADSESAFYLRSSSRMIPYESFIIMPFAHIEEDSYSARAILLQKICGFLAPKDSIESARETIRDYLTESGLESWDDVIFVSEKSLQDKGR